MIDLTRSEKRELQGVFARFDLLQQQANAAQSDLAEILAELAEHRGWPKGSVGMPQTPGVRYVLDRASMSIVPVQMMGPQTGPNVAPPGPPPGANGAEAGAEAGAGR